MQFWGEVDKYVLNTFVSARRLPVWLVMKAIRVSSVLSVWLKRAIGLVPWNSKMLGTATVPKRVDKLHTQKNTFTEKTNIDKMSETAILTPQKYIHIKNTWTHMKHIPAVLWGIKSEEMHDGKNSWQSVKMRGKVGGELAPGSVEENQWAFRAVRVQEVHQVLQETET